MKATLHILDEVNIKFEGLEVNTRRKLNQALEFFLPHARHTPAFKLGRWNGKVSFCDLAARSYFHLLDKLLPIVINDGYDLAINDLRTVHEFSFTPVDEHTYAHKTWPRGHPAEAQPIILRDYQVQVINNFLTNLQSLQVSPTGSGKTIITAALSQQCEQYGRTIVIVPNKDLVVQTEKDYINLGLDVGVYFGDRKDYNRTHTICTWQSLAVLEKSTKAGTADIPIQEFVDNVVCIMVDEVHKSKADVLRGQLSGIFRNVPIRWGLTGTIPKEKNDEMACVSCLGPVISALTSRELQDKGVLAELHVSIFQLQDGVLGFKDYAQELKWLVTNEQRVSQISEMINQISQSGNTLVLIDRIATGDMLQALNPDWVFVSGEMKGTKRQAEYAEINESDNRVTVATYGVAAVGINIPRIFNLVMLEPGKSFVRVVQSIGRGIRKAADKDYVNIYDITSTLKYSKRHLALRKQYYKEQQFPYTMTKINYK